MKWRGYEKQNMQSGQKKINTHFKMPFFKFIFKIEIIKKGVPERFNIFS